jgi:hypothetical protein
MRARGLTNFPDEATVGKLPTPQDLGVSSTVFQAAYDACKHPLPNGGSPPSPASPELLNKLLKLARCMRSHGFPSWPDPTLTPLGFPVGSPAYTFRLQGVQFDPRSPQVDTTLNECQHLTGLETTGPPPFGLARPPS